MYDRQSISLWIHTTSEAVIGKHQGKTLGFLPSTITTWRNWRTKHPATQVLNVRQGRNHRFNLRKNPHTGGLSVGHPDNDLKFYPLSILQKEHLINDTLSDKKIVVLFHPETFAFAAFESGDREFTWKAGNLLDQTGQEWNALTGKAGKQRLKRLPVVSWLTKAWKRFYPEGVIYSTTPPPN